MHRSVESPSQETGNEIRLVLAGRVDPVIQLVCRYLAKQYSALLEHDPVVRECLDPAGAHQMRVSTRRIRAVLKAFGDVVPGRSARFFLKEFKWLASALSGLRDLDVHLEGIRSHSGTLAKGNRDVLAPYEDYLVRQRSRARGRMRACLDSRRYARLCERFRKFLDVHRDAARQRGRAAQTIRECAGRVISRRIKRLLQMGDDLALDSPSEELHSLRIQGKRLRYVLEVFQPAFPEEMRESIRATRRLQENLGSFQDAQVASCRLLEFAGRVPLLPDRRRLLLALGQLVYSQECQAKEHRARFHRKWKGLKKRILSKKLRALLKGGLEDSVPNRENGERRTVARDPKRASRRSGLLTRRRTKRLVS